jgi:hypothetical protein
MNKLNKSLFAVLAVLLIVSCIGSVLAYSDQGSGSISQVDDDSVEDADDVISVSDVSDDDSPSGDNSVSLSRHSTGNPLILLLGALAFAGISARRL